MHIRDWLRALGLALGLTACGAGVLAGSVSLWLPAGAAAVFLLLNLFPTGRGRGLPFARRVERGGAALLSAFLLSIGLQAVLLLVWRLREPSAFAAGWWRWLLMCLVADSLVFWNGILRVYLCAPVLGAKWRVLGLLCGWIPVVHLVVLGHILRLVYFDIHAEEERAARNARRAGQRVCATRYPLVLIHGVFFRDVRYLNYWGRIPAQLEQNGATVYYGGQQSALSVADSAAEIAAAVRRIVADTGCGRVNLIAHSKGGLDARYACSRLGLAPLVASLTTSNTRHRGCAFADWLLSRVSPRFRDGVARTYNAALRRLGDSTPDFLAAVNDLTADRCAQLNAVLPDAPGVYYQSTASCIHKPLRGAFPLCLTHDFVGLFDGENDGLVSVTSAAWGARCIRLDTPAPEGISHADMIDMSRRNRPDFDVCEWYVELVSDLKSRGF